MKNQICFGLLASAEDMLKMLVKARTNIKETTVKRLWEKATMDLFSYISDAEIFHRLQIVLRYFSNVSTRSDGGKEDEIFTCQKKYAADLLKRFHMSNCIVKATPINPSEKLQLNDGTRKAYAKFFRRLSLKKQRTLALLSSEVEYATVTYAAGQALWLSKLLVDFNVTSSFKHHEIQKKDAGSMSIKELLDWIEEEARSKQRVDDVGAFDHLAMDVRYSLDKGIEVEAQILKVIGLCV
ncbi:uncharacterized mitochondrial protein-like protein [Tanacetum coccineum]